MDLPASGLVARAASDATRKKVRYACVALAFLPIGQGLVQLLGSWFDDYVTASVLAACLATIPNFFANRYFVWRVTSDRQLLRKQMLVFWLAVMTGTALATAFTYFVDQAIDDQSTLVRGMAVLLAQLLGFGLVWAGRYLILDRWLFKHSARLVERPRAARVHATA